MKVLVIGSGGREHAIVTSVARSPRVDKIYCAPGNAGIAALAECVPIGAMEFDKLVAFAKEKSIDFTIVGMDDPLVGGIVDVFEAEGLKVFGPRKNAAILEGSKAFSKDLMKKYHIPTAAYENFTDPEEALKYLETAKMPIVLKADGLALGKGVLICNTLEEAKEGVRTIMEDKKFGNAGNTMVIEEFMTGREVSVLTYVDGKTIRIMSSAQDHEIEKTLDMAKLVRMCKPALDEQKRVIAKLFIKNTDRVTGTILGSEISRRYGDEGLPEDTISLSFVGSAGQSFGAFIPKGLTLTLEGDANDYVGKGLSGGKIIIYPPREATFRAEDNVIIGNVAFFGATSGEAFVSGKAGERFCVRNSGATVVVEGIGNHGCEYMTGGKVIILGETGKNFAAGMSGGVAYVLDLDERLCNQELIHLEPLTDKEEIASVKKLIDAHYLSTRSRKAESILARWDVYYSRFTKVIPKEYEAMEEAIRTGMAEGLTREEAIRKAYDKKFGK